MVAATSSFRKTEPVIPLHKKLVVGGIAGVIGASATFPIDIVKTRLQSQVAGVGGVMPYSGPIDCFRKIIRIEGPQGLYRGLPPTLVGIIPEKAIKLAVNDCLREYLTDEITGELTIGNQLLAAAGAGTAQVIATNPLEIVKIRMQTQSLLPIEQRMTAVQIVQHLGLRGLYKGTISTLLRDVPYGIVFFPTYANIKKAFEDDQGNSSLSSIVGSGAVAGAAAAALVTPSDVIKTRIQMRGANFAGVGDCFRHVVQTEGYSALFRGIGPRMLVQAPLFGITLLAFEMQKKMMTERIASTL